MEILGKLFGSNHIVKILRLFLFNPEDTFENNDIIARTKVPEEIVRVERSMLERIGLIKKRSFYKEVERKRGKKIEIVKKRTQGWGLDTTFIYLTELRRFIYDTATIDGPQFLKKVRKAGSPKAIILSGFFVGTEDIASTVDMLIIGDNLNEKKLATAIKDLDAEMGKEIRYAVFDSKEFKYRQDIRDRLVRDVLDYPHKILVDKINVS